MALTLGHLGASYVGRDKSFFKDLFIYFKEERRKKERERSIDHMAPTEDQPTTQARALTRNRTSNPSLCRAKPNQLSHTGQGRDKSFCASPLSPGSLLQQGAHDCIGQHFLT